MTTPDPPTVADVLRWAELEFWAGVATVLGVLANLALTVRNVWLSRATHRQQAADAEDYRARLTAIAERLDDAPKG